MEDEVQVVEENKVEAEAQEESAFSATFDKTVRSEELPTQTEVVETETSAETETEGEVAATEQATEQQAETETETQSETASTGLTPDQLTAMLAKLPALEEMTNSEVRKLHGKFGEINRALQELQKGGSAKRGGKITADKLKRVTEEFGEEFAASLAEDLNNAFGSEEPATSEAVQQPVNVDERVAVATTEIRQELEQKMQMNLLTIQHRDWVQVKDSDEFKVWKQTLPAEDQKELENTWDAMYLSDKFTEFKSWRSKKLNGSNQRKERVTRAITPQGTQQRPQRVELTEEDGFAAAFKR